MARTGRDAAPLVRHRPQHWSNAVVDYIQQSMSALVPQEKPQSAPKQRRQRPRKKGHAKAVDRLVKAQRWRVRIQNQLTPQELKDDDEYGDTVADLQSDLARFGAVSSLHVDRTTGVILVEYNDAMHAAACVDAKHRRLYGGKELAVTVECVEKDDQEGAALMTAADDTSDRDVPTRLRPKQRRKRRSKIKNAVLHAREMSTNVRDKARAFTVRNMVEADEVENDDEYDEVVGDVADVLGRHGEITKLTVVREGDDDDDPDSRPGDVVVEYVYGKAALAAFEATNDSKYGGRTLVCSWVESPSDHETIVHVDGMLDPDELQDEDEYHDVCEEVEGFLKGFLDGWDDLSIERDTGRVILRFQSDTLAVAAVETLAQKSYGGRRLLVGLHEPPQRTPTLPALPLQKPITEAMDVPTPPVSEAFVTLLAAFLLRLASLQERAHIQNPLHDKRSRRLVLGLHEVRRGLQSHKIKLLLLATDFDGCDVVDDRLGEITAIATREEIPMIQALTRRKLGRILKKHARVSCIGVYSYEGANDQFREILQEHERLGRAGLTMTTLTE